MLCLHSPVECNRELVDLLASYSALLLTPKTIPRWCLCDLFQAPSFWGSQGLPSMWLCTLFPSFDAYTESSVSPGTSTMSLIACAYIVHAGILCCEVVPKLKAGRGHGPLCHLRWGWQHSLPMERKLQPSCVADSCWGVSQAKAQEELASVPDQDQGTQGVIQECLWWQLSHRFT